MNTVVNYETQDTIAIITLNSPPVNGLGQPLRRAIKEAFETALADDSIKAMVISSSGKIFCGGADVSEFGSPLAFAEPKLPELLNQLEASSKPIVAAINGLALGGGCELALACDYRVAHAKAKLGLPEVNLGIIPGAGGTQRLPRLAAVETALQMIVTGKAISAKQALAGGIIDMLVDEDSDFLAAVIDYAKTLVANGAAVKSCVDLSVDANSLPENLFDDFRKSIARKTRGFLAPECAIQAVEGACELSLKEGLALEEKLFMQCAESPQARAQQHLFFAERAAVKIPGIDSKISTRPINKVAIIGSGTMGGGIAMNFLNAGFETTILDLNAEALERGLGVVRKNYDISVKRGRITGAEVDERMALLKSTCDYSDLGEMDLVIEAVFENMEVKKKVFTALDEVCKPGAILASNTSTLDVDEIATATSRPSDVIGLHFFSPANVMKLLEIVRGEKTADDVLVTSLKLAKTIGKVSAVSSNSWGFIGNRVLEPYGREAARLILEGANPAQVDKVLTDFGLAMGPLSMNDLAGIDIGYFARQAEKDKYYSRDPSYAAISDKLCELKRFGQKTGRGFYIYEGRDKKQDPEVMELAAELAKQHGVTQRDISDQEILERTIYMLINEGAQILEEGVAYRSGDIDIIYCNGYGFPAYRGGPMQYADEIGLQTVVDALEKHRNSLGEYGEEWFKPASLLKKLAAEGKSFKDFSQ
ncbi:3-hydroxyacyl-CoA dehydrogenase NAD-binding domain-containing protein [uncultured Oceanicoccus sp.]|uniref:3-hydroxyacyl-CoA dehydrogenase NAD-binding domain-containing protein n=1 Tax=uncultured Oceanicoccus sp. TaxID=1706381 RepID=UPI0030D88C69